MHESQLLVPAQGVQTVTGGVFCAGGLGGVGAMAPVEPSDELSSELPELPADPPEPPKGRLVLPGAGAIVLAGGVDSVTTDCDRLLSVGVCFTCT